MASTLMRIMRSVSVAGLPAAAAARLTEYRIDDAHSNAYAEWKRMGSPIAPNDAQYGRLIEASKLSALRSEDVPISNRGAEVAVWLPRQAVSLLVLELAGAR